MSLLHLEMDLELKLSTPALHVFPQFVYNNVQISLFVVF